MGCMCGQRKTSQGNTQINNGYIGPITESNGVLKGVVTFFHENKKQIESSSSSQPLMIPESLLAAATMTYVIQPVVIDSLAASQLWASLAAVVIVAFIIGFIIAIVFAKSCINV
jgi:hypothetical protein